MGTMSTSADAIIVSVIQDMRTLHYCQLAATFILLYDHCITFGLEVELVWKKRWSTSKILFLCNRYLGDLVLICECVIFLKYHPSREVRLTGFTLLSVGSSLLIWISQVISQLRIYALYGNNNKIALYIGTMFGCEIAGMAFFVISTHMTLDANPEPFPGVHVCAGVNIPHYTYLFWVPMIVFETFLFFLALRICIEHIREIRTMNRWNGRSVLNVLLRDSMGYFILTLTAYATTAIMWLTAPQSWLEIPSCFCYSLTTVMSCRLVLNLSEAYHKPFSRGQDSFWSSTFPTQSTAYGMQFAMGSISTHTSAQLRAVDTGFSMKSIKGGKTRLDAARQAEDGASGGEDMQPVSWRWDEKSGRLDVESAENVSLPAGWDNSEDHEGDGAIPE